MCFYLKGCAACCGNRATPHNEVESVVARGPDRIDLIPELLAAVRAFMKLPEAESLASANKRIDNILKKADGVPSSFESALLFEPAERSLGDAFIAVQPWAEQLYASGDYSAMLKSLVPLKLPVDRFFDEVMVNVDDAKLRANRLGLLRGAAYDDESSRRHLQAQHLAPMQDYCAPRSCVSGAQRTSRTCPLLDATSGLLATSFIGC